MVKKKKCIDVKEFKKRFIESRNVSDMVQEYDKFRNYAIQHRIAYEQFKKSPFDENMKLELEEYSWKKYAFDLFQRIMELKDCLREKDRRRELVNKIVLILEDAAKQIEESPQLLGRVDISYYVLYLMLDIICAFSKDNKHKIQFSAMIYDMSCTLNTKGEFYPKVYGERVENMIIKRSLENFRIINKSQNKFFLTKNAQNHKLISWIESVSKSSNVKFVSVFCDELIMEINNNSLKSDREVPKERETDNKKKSRIVGSGLFLIILVMAFLAVCLVLYKKIEKGASLEHRIETLQKEKKVLEEQIMKFCTESEILKEKNQKLEKENIDLDKKMDELQSRIEFYDIDYSQIYGAVLDRIYAQGEKCTCEYTLLDINGDGKKELLVNYGYEEGDFNSAVYTIIGKVDERLGVISERLEFYKVQDDNGVYGKCEQSVYRLNMENRFDLYELKETENSFLLDGTRIELREGTDRSLFNNQTIPYS